MIMNVILLLLFLVGCYLWGRAFWMSTRDADWRDREDSAYLFFMGMPIWGLFILLGAVKLIYYVFE